MGTQTGVRRVTGAGLDLAVREHTAWSPGKQTIVLVHGYPDQQDVWDLVVGCLPPEQMHVVSYDVRGAGASDVPAERSGYRTELLVADLAAVVEAVAPGGVHLVGHDWGSVQLWDAVSDERSDPRLRGRIASFTSISGPSLDHAAYLARHSRGRRARLLRQNLASWYVYAFHVPVVPDLLWRHGHGLATRLLGGPATGHWGPDLGRDAEHGLNLYRANMLRRMRAPRRLRTDVPVLVIRPGHDPYISEVLYDELGTACSDLRFADVDAGHWVIRSHPAEVAGLVADHVRAHPARPVAEPR